MKEMTLQTIEPWMYRKDGKIDRKFKLATRKRFTLEGQKLHTTNAVKNYTAKEEENYWIRVPKEIVRELGVRVSLSELDLKVKFERME